MNDAYSNFIQKLMEVIDKVAPVKNKRIKRNSQEWFDSEISEKLIIQDKLFKKYKRTRLHVDKEINKSAWYIVKNLIAKKKKEFFGNKLKECISKPKDLWKAIKSLGLPNKSGGCIIGVLAENQIVKHDTKSILKTFKSFYSNLAGNLLAKLPKSSNRCTIKFVSDYYKNFHYLKISNWTKQLKIICLIYWKMARSQKQQELTKFQENLIYVNDMPMAVKCNLFLYADDTCLVFQSKNVKDIEKQLNEDFANICDWFVDNKLSIHFGEDKNKSILFASKRKIKNFRS